MAPTTQSSMRTASTPTIPNTDRVTRNKRKAQESPEELQVMNRDPMSRRKPPLPRNSKKLRTIPDSPKPFKPTAEYYAPRILHRPNAGNSVATIARHLRQRPTTGSLTIAGYKPAAPASSKPALRPGTTLKPYWPGEALGLNNDDTEAAHPFPDEMYREIIANIFEKAPVMDMDCGGFVLRVAWEGKMEVRKNDPHETFAGYKARPLPTWILTCKKFLKITLDLLSIYGTFIVIPKPEWQDTFSGWTPTASLFLAQAKHIFFHCVNLEAARLDYHQIGRLSNVQYEITLPKARAAVKHFADALPYLCANSKGTKDPNGAPCRLKKLTLVIDGFDYGDFGSNDPTHFQFNLSDMAILGKGYLKDGIHWAYPQARSRYVEPQDVIDNQEIWNSMLETEMRRNLDMLGSHAK